MCAVAPAGRQHATLASRALLAGRGASRSRSACPPAARRTAPRRRRSLVVRPQRLRTRNVGRGWCSLSLPPGSSRVLPGIWTSVERRPEPTANSGGPRRQGWRAVARPSRHVPHAAAAGEAEQIGRRREAHDRSGRLHRDDRGQLGGVPGRPKAARSATSGGQRGAAAAPLLRPGGEGAPLGRPPCAGGRGPGAEGRPHGLLRARARSTAAASYGSVDVLAHISKSPSAGGASCGAIAHARCGAPLLLVGG